MEVCLTVPLTQGPSDGSGYRDPSGSRLERWAHGGKSERAAPARPVWPVVPRLPGRPRPSYLPLRAAPWAEQAPGCPLRSAGAGSCHSSRALGAASQVLLWVLSPRLSPGPRPASICRTPASPDTGAGSHRARGEREGLSPRRRPWRGPHFPGARAAARAGRRTTPPTPGASSAPPPPGSLRAGTAPRRAPRT